MKINLKFLLEVLKTWKGWFPKEHRIEIIDEEDIEDICCPNKRQDLLRKLKSLREHIAGLIIATRKGMPHKWLVSLISHFISKLQQPPPPIS